MAGTLQPLDEKFAIVDETGKPTLYFIQWAQQKQIDIQASITSEQFDTLLVQYLLDHMLQEGDGIALTPDGNISNSPEISVRNGTGLDFDGMQNLKIADTAVTPGTYGDATHVGQFTVDQQGRITFAQDVAISGGGGGSGTSYEAGPITPPTLASLPTWDNQGTSTASDGTGAFIIKPQVNSEIHGRYTTAPATPYDIYCRVDMMTLSSAALTTNMVSSAGILFKDTAGDNERFCFVTQQERVGGDENILYAIYGVRWTGATPPVQSGGGLFVRYSNTPYKWLRVNNDGTTLTCYTSIDGKNWLLVGTETLAAFIDAAGSYGVFARATSNDTELVASFPYFSTTAPS